MSHSASKSSKNKKSKQKGKGKADSSAKEAWRQEAVSNLEQSTSEEKQAAEKFSDYSKETQPISPISNTEPKPELDAIAVEEERIMKSQNEVTEKTVPAIKTEGTKESDSGTEPKMEMVAESEANLAGAYSAGEKYQPDVVLKQESVVPLRSKGELNMIHVLYFFL